eukprot:TRINITY_DN59_c0_g1_i2.p1 TRINITY_DN59_c0_g1~~TRINITY_DN59_c0_g1_i2.p1  ORF type:complete len:168 (+),score=49.45 TRINITY_DN59_c0_g1_i2:67-570(+)
MSATKKRKVASAEQDDIDWGEPAPAGMIYRVFRREWANKHKHDKTRPDRSFNTERQALLYCARKNFDGILHSMAMYGLSLEDYKLEKFRPAAVLAMTNDQLKAYIAKLEEAVEAEHDGTTYRCVQERVETPMSPNELLAIISAEYQLDGEDDEEEYDDDDEDESKNE